MVEVRGDKKKAMCDMLDREMEGCDDDLRLDGFPYDGEYRC